MTYVSPGLVSREIISVNEEEVTIREIWDPRVKGCPVLIFDQSVWPWVTRTDVESVTHTYKRSTAGWRAEEKAR
jgi:hypothetical protein